jgi:hypothetical protein
MLLAVFGFPKSNGGSVGAPIHPRHLTWWLEERNESLSATAHFMKLRYEARASI